MNAIRIKQGGVLFVIFPQGFELLPSQSSAMKFSQTSLSSMLLCCSLAALHLLAQGRQPACHCIQSPATLFYRLILSSLANCLYFERIPVLVKLLQKGDCALLHEFTLVECQIPCLPISVKFWLGLAVNSHYMWKLNPYPIFARDKLAQVKFQVLLRVGKCIWHRPEFVL